MKPNPCQGCKAPRHGRPWGPCASKECGIEKTGPKGQHSWHKNQTAKQKKRHEDPMCGKCGCQEE